jgi:DNA-binding transcriptional MerR regulator
VRIGDFARAGGVTARTLRFYDQAGVLRPARRNPLTGYREYDAGQLSELASILALRQLGVSLDEIKGAPRRWTPAGRMALLERTAERLRQSIAASERSLRWVEAVLRRPEGPVGPAVVLRHQPAIEVAALRTSLRSSTDVVALELYLLELVPPSCRGTFRGTLWHECPDVSASAEVESFVEIVRRPPFRSELTLRRLPAVTAACAYSVDEEGASRRAFAEVGCWMAARGYELGSSKRELCWPGLLEIQFPIAKV